MISVLMLTLFFSFVSITQTLNPVKISLMLLMTSTMVFSLSYLWSSSLWFPMIMYLVFMGGILMMFMILSSILPNQKTSKNLKNFLWMTSLCLAQSVLLKANLTSCSSGGIKNLLSSSMTMLFFFLSITSYFLIVIFMVKMMKSPLRVMDMC